MSLRKVSRQDSLQPGTMAMNWLDRALSANSLDITSRHGEKSESSEKSE
jgi:hypothetical protein